MPYVRSKRYPELFKKDGSPYWWCFLPNPAGGRALRESTKLRDELAAHRWYLGRVRQPIERSDQATDTKERTLRDALDIRIAWLEQARKSNDPTRRKLSAATVEFYKKKSRHLTRLLGKDTLLSEIGHEEIRSYITQRTAETSKSTTVAKELTTLSMAMRLARKDGVSCHAFRDIKPDDFVVKYVPKDRWCDEREVDALVFSGVLPSERAAVVAFIVATSATYPSEVVPVRPEMVDKYTVRIPGTKRATRDRTLKVPSHARKYFDFAMKHLTDVGFRPWGSINRDLLRAAELLSMCAGCRCARLAWARHEDGATKPTKAPCKACDRAPRFAPLCPTDLRRTFAQWLVRSGVPYEVAYPLMGHGSSRMLEQVYGRRDATAVADLVEVALKRAPKGARRVTAG